MEALYKYTVITTSAKSPPVLSIFISFNGFDNLPNHLRAKISDLTYGLNEIKKVI